MSTRPGGAVADHMRQTSLKREEERRKKKQQEAFLQSLTLDDLLDIAGLYRFIRQVEDGKRPASDLPTDPEERQAFIEDMRPRGGGALRAKAKRDFDEWWEDGAVSTVQQLEDLFRIMEIFPAYWKITPQDVKVIQEGKDPFTQIGPEDNPIEREGLPPIRGRIYETAKQDSRLAWPNRRPARRVFRVHPIFDPPTQSVGAGGPLTFWARRLIANPARTVGREYLGPSIALRKEQRGETAEDRLALLRERASYNRGFWNRNDQFRRADPRDILRMALKGRPRKEGEERRRLGIGRGFEHGELLREVTPGYGEIPANRDYREIAGARFIPRGSVIPNIPLSKIHPWLPDTGRLNLIRGEPAKWAVTQDPDRMESDRHDAELDEMAKNLGFYEAGERLQRELFLAKRQIKNIQGRVSSGALGEEEAKSRILQILRIDPKPSILEESGVMRPPTTLSPGQGTEDEPQAPTPSVAPPAPAAPRNAAPQLPATPQTEITTLPRTRKIRRSYRRNAVTGEYVYPEIEVPE